MYMCMCPPYACTAHRTARGLGLGFITLAIIGYYYYRTSGGAYCKQLTVFNVILTGLFIIPAFFGGSSAVSGVSG